MAEYIGDFQQNSLIVHTFNTIGVVSNPVLMRGVSARVGRESDGEFTEAGLTIEQNINQVVGTHRATIDTSADPFYVPSDDYFLYAATGKAQDTDVTGRVIFRFSIKNRFPQ